MVRAPPPARARRANSVKRVKRSSRRRRLGVGTRKCGENAQSPRGPIRDVPGQSEDTHRGRTRCSSLGVLEQRWELRCCSTRRQQLDMIRIAGASTMIPSMIRTQGPEGALILHKAARRRVGEEVTGARSCPGSCTRPKRGGISSSARTRERKPTTILDLTSSTPAPCTAPARGARGGLSGRGRAVVVKSLLLLYVKSNHRVQDACTMSALCML